MACSEIGDLFRTRMVYPEFLPKGILVPQQMEKDILGKLIDVVASGKYNEPVVMYILVEIRKLTEQGQVNNCNRILFMADWVVHYKLDRKPTKLLLEKLENDISRSDHGKAIIDLVSFQELRVELINFFKSHGINTAKLRVNWRQFSTALVDIISDCPLENEQGRVITKFQVKRSGRNYEYSAQVVPGSLAHLGSEFKNIAGLTGTLLAMS